MQHLRFSLWDRILNCIFMWSSDLEKYCSNVLTLLLSPPVSTLSSFFILSSPSFSLDLSVHYLNIILSNTLNSLSLCLLKTFLLIYPTKAQPWMSVFVRLLQAYSRTAWRCHKKSPIRGDCCQYTGTFKSLLIFHVYPVNSLPLFLVIVWNIVHSKTAYILNSSFTADDFTSSFLKKIEGIRWELPQLPATKFIQFHLYQCFLFFYFSLGDSLLII